MDISQKLKASSEAAKIKIANTPEFILSNPLKWEKNFLLEVVNQYENKKRIYNKVPQWASFNILAYNQLSAEQCSSSVVAQFRFKDIQAKTSIDLTGGLGVDSFFLAQKSEKHTYIEKNSDLLAVVKHNFDVLGQFNIDVDTADAIKIIDTLKVDIVFLDPDRRPDQKTREYSIENCEPNFFEIEDLLLKNTQQIIIKLSPMINLNEVFHKIKFLSKVSLLSVNNELKEIVAYIDPSTVKTVEVLVANYQYGSWTTDFLTTTRSEFEINYSDTKKYLYEPSVGFMKLGAWSYLSNTYQVEKLAKNSHLFTSDHFAPNFPGRIYEVHEAMDFKKKYFKHLYNKEASIISRNFDHTADHLRQKFRIKESAENFLIFTRDLKGKRIVLNAKRIFKPQ